MSTLKKILALSLALAMILSVSVFAGYTTDSYKDAAAIDKDAVEAVELMYALDIMTGDEKGNFNPNATITRAEVAKMIYVILNKGKDDKAATYAAAQLFTDVPSTAWYAGYINYLAAVGLVNGSEGKFYPTNPVKTAEAAKMLLTAIGYNSEDRQYVGANWAKNVLSDASIVGLLNSTYKYGADINGAAPRQWVAVMFANALLDAFTYKTVVPAGFNGIFTGAKQNEFIEFGKKFYGLEQLTGVAVASSNATIHEGASVAGSDKATFLTDDGNVTVKGTGLGYMDLGQKYRVIYKKGSTNVAYSCCLTGESVVAEARVMDITVDINYKTDNNDAYNKYVFTVDGEEFRLPKNGREVRELAVYPQANQGATAYTKHIVSATMATNLVNKIAAIGNQAMTAKVIDADGNGTVDYVIAVTYQYAYVHDVVVNDKYGEYAVIKMVNNQNLTFAGKNRLYVNDCIVDAPELEEGNYLKYTWNPDEEMFAVEILDVIEDAKFENRNVAKGIYLLDGEEYVFAANGWVAALEELLKKPAKNKVKETMDIVVDGDLLVYAQSKDSNYTDMADVNAQLVLVLDAGDRFSNGYIHDVNGIKYMTIDGDVEVAEYVNKAGFVQFNTLYGAGTRELDKQTNTWGRLFILHKSGSKVYLEELNNTGKNPNEQLSASTKLLNGYTEVLGDKELDATKTVKLDGNKVAEGNLFFVRYEDSNGVQYKVMALSELTGGKDAHAYAQVLTLTNDAGTRTTIVGGYVAFDLTTATDNGYLYVTNAGTWDGDKVAVTFDDGKEAEITVENLENGKIVLNALYSYRYNVLDDDYTLTMVQAAASGADFWLESNMIDFSDDEVYVKKPDGTKVKYALDDEVIAVLNVEIDRDTEGAKGKDPMAFAVDNQGIEFVKLADLTDEMVINGDEGSTYTQYTDAIYRAGDLFYVIRYSVMNECQEDASFNQNVLYKQLEKIGIKLWK